MKILIISALVAVCLAEPPVDTRYLPPSSGGAPSQVYGTPGAPGLQRQTDAVFRSRQPSHGGSRRPSSQYGAPQPSSRYGPPQSSSGHFGAPSTQYGAPGGGQVPSSQYGAPSSQYAAPSSQYGAPSSQYGAPSSQYGAPSSQYGSPSSQYGAPSASPSQQYGAPGFGGAGGHSHGGSFGGQAQSRQYLPPGRGGYGSDDGSNGEPANYHFEYMVKDDQSGNDFGHQESRQGDRAEGRYYVLLPDGRKQTVQYEADQDGYKPKITYEDTGLGQGGYDRNSQSGYNGYQGQGPY